MNGVTPHTDKTLSIRISTDGFCFCCYTETDPDSLQYHFYETDNSKSLVANFDEAWRGCRFATQHKYGTIQTIVATSHFTAIPSEYNNKEDNETFYRTCFPQTPPDDKILTNRLTAHGVTILFSLDSSLYTRLTQIGEVTFYTPSSILIGYLSRNTIEKSRYMLAYYHKSTSTLLSIDEGKIQLTNSFNSSEPHNQAYYLLSIWKEQNLSQTDDTLYLCGDRNVEEITPLVSQFIADIRRINPTDEFRPHLLNKIKEIPFDLQALLLCE